MKKTTKDVAEAFFQLNVADQAIAMRYLENLILGKTKENKEIKKSLGMKDRRTD